MKTKRSGAARRGRTEHEQDLARIAKLHEQGKTITEIAFELNLSRNTVWKDLKELESRWRKDGMLDMQRVRMRQFREIRQLREEAWEAWRKSKEPEKEVTQEESKSGEGKGSKKSSRASVKTKNTSGQAKFLSVIKDLISLEAELVGTKVPRIISSDDDPPPQLQGGVIKIPAFMPDEPPKKPKA